MVDNPSQDILEKVVGAQPLKHQKKTMHSASVLLEAHQPDCFGCDDKNDRSVGNPKRKV
jgi:hypothetical protein